MRFGGALVVVVALSLLAGCSTVTVRRAVTPEEAASFPNLRLVAVEHAAGPRERLREPIGIFGQDRDTYILTASGHRPLRPGDRVVVEGEFSVGQRVVGGGIVARRADPALLIAGSALLVIGTAIAIGGGVHVARPDPPGTWLSLREFEIIPVVAASVPLVASGAAMIIVGARFPKAVGGPLEAVPQR